MAGRIATWLADARLHQVLQIVQLIKAELTKRGVTFAWSASQVDAHRSKSKRYQLRVATWTVVREPGLPSPRVLSAPDAVAVLARDLVRVADDDKERFRAVLLNAQNHYVMHTLVSVGTQSASLVRRCPGPC